VGTTLVEVLVVIVILLVGILAVVQVFPKGFLLLSLSRKSAQATALAREESERLKTRADLLPEMVLAVNGSNIDSSVLPSDLGPAGASVGEDGSLYDANNNLVGNWASHSGANRFRLIIGETHRVPAPRSAGATSAYFGGVLYPEFGPVDPSVPISVRGNDLTKTYGVPDGLSQRVGTQLFDTVDTHGDFEFFSVNNLVYLPTGPEDRAYRISVYALIGRDGRLEKRLFRDLAVSVAATTVGVTNTYPLGQVDLSTAIAAKLGTGESLGSLELDSLRVSRSFREVVSFSADKFEYKRLNPVLGVLLINPKAYSATVSTGNGREPLTASLDYAVLDWRILRDDYRVTDWRQSDHRLPLGSIKTSTVVAFDGVKTLGIPLVEPKPTVASGYNDISDSQSVRDDHVVVLDSETGGVYYETDPAVNTRPALITIDKSIGVVRFVDADPSTPESIEGKLLLPDGSVRTLKIIDRPLRVLYMAKDEWSVQVMKAASQYSLSPGLPGAAQFYVGASDTTIGGVGTRLYFPAGDANQKVTIGEINYLDADGGKRQLLGQDFVVRYRTGDSVGLPSLDLTDVAEQAASFDFSLGAVKAVKGASVVIRVLWNPDAVSFSSNKLSNLRKVDAWGRGWRRSTAQTFIQRGENIR